MFKFGDTTYYEIGDAVEQNAYPGCPAVVTEVSAKTFCDLGHLYTIKIDAEGHPEAFDENGEPETIKWTRVYQAQMPGQKGF